MKKTNTTKQLLANRIKELESTGAYKLNVSRSNKKLVPNKKTGFVIWNLPSVITCPYATPHCKKFCYAKKAEIAYPDCLPSRKRNFQESIKQGFADNMTLTILSIAKGMRKKELIVRIHESGDFYNKKYAMAWLKIIEECKIDSRIKFIAYTKSFPYFDGVELPDNFSLRASIWDDTKAEQLETIERNGWNIYTAIEEFTKNDTFEHCECSDCATCGKCWDNTKHDIRCEIH